LIPVRSRRCPPLPVNDAGVSPIAGAAMKPALFAFVVSIASGCTMQQAYHSAQSWQRNECNRVVDSGERERCIESTTMRYDDYKRQTEDRNKP
jgi:hypothetical protein